MHLCVEKIKSFGILNHNKKIKYCFKKCPIDLDENKRYIVFGENNNIITKKANTQYEWVGIMCENQLFENTENIWKIKILNSSHKYIMVLVCQIDFNINKSSYSNCGWYYYIANSTLYSGPPYKYRGKALNLSNVKDEITVIMDMKKGALKFIINNQDKGFSYEGIPLNKPLFPIVFLDENGDSIEIIDS